MKSSYTTAVAGIVFIRCENEKLVSGIVYFRYEYRRL